MWLDHGWLKQHESHISVMERARNCLINRYLIEFKMGSNHFMASRHTVTIDADVRFIFGMFEYGTTGGRLIARDNHRNAIHASNMTEQTGGNDVAECDGLERYFVYWIVV